MKTTDSLLLVLQSMKIAKKHMLYVMSNLDEDSMEELIRDNKILLEGDELCYGQSKECFRLNQEQEIENKLKYSLCNIQDTIHLLQVIGLEHVRFGPGTSVPQSVEEQVQGDTNSPTPIPQDQEMGF